MTDDSAIAFVDLGAQYSAYKTEIDHAIHVVLDHGKFIMGPEVAQLETALCGFSGATEAIACSNGTDALLMIMLAEGIGPGDAVFVPSFTFTATAEILLLLGAVPVFVDVDEQTFNIAPSDLERQIERIKREGNLKPRGILAVDLFGQPADYARIEDIASAYGLLLWDDAAQSFGGELGQKKVGALCRATSLSFFPAKPFGCYGDGGAVLCSDEELASTMRSIRAHGKGGAKYDIVRVGMNARLDTVQAAILLAKLPHFEAELKARNAVATAYSGSLSNVVQVPTLLPEARSAWAQYTIKVPSSQRDAIADRLKQAGVPTAVYYPKPMHLQTAYRDFGEGEGSLKNCEALSQQVLSLPMHPFLPESQIEKICDAVKASVAAV